MISSYNKLQKEFDEKVDELQKVCKHKKLTPWMEIMWVPGHSSDSSCRRCISCNKQTHLKYLARLCRECSNLQHWQLVTCSKCKKKNSDMVEVFKRYGKIVHTKILKTN